MQKTWTGMAAAIALTIVTMGAGSQAAADPIIGGFTSSGNFEWVTSAGADVAVADSTSIDFRTLASPATATPGVAGEFIVLQATGTFALLGVGLGDIGLITDFSVPQLLIQEGASATAAFPAPPILSFQLVEGFTFDLLAITSVQPNSSGSLDIFGTGVFHHAGFDDTPGSWAFSGQTVPGSGLFSFSATNFATPSVPEPATLILLGAGLVAGTLFARNRR